MQIWFESNNPKKQLEIPPMIPVAPKLVPSEICAAIFLAPKSQLAKVVKNELARVLGCKKSESADWKSIYFIPDKQHIYKKIKKYVIFVKKRETHCESP